MQARAPLMIEHRLIEKMLGLVGKALTKVEAQEAIDPLLVDTVVDFIRTYADRTHHGKEEDILFRELANKDLSSEDRRVMNELIAEHAIGRRITQELIAANSRYRDGDRGSLAVIVARLATLIDFYPKHIAKEDKVFFPASRAYFSDAEDQALLREFLEFDQKMIHEKYQNVVHELARA